MRFQVQGYAAVWNEEPADQSRGYGAMAPNSIALNAHRNIELRYGVHDSIIPYARTRDGTLSFWNDERGLCFSAWIDEDIRGAYAMKKAIGSGLVWGASWGARSMDDLIVTGPDQRVQHAKIEEVTLLANPNYEGTGCWLADQPYRARAPWLLDMSFQYGETLLARTRVPARAHGTEARDGGSLGRQPVPRPSLPASLAALMNRADWQDAARRHSKVWRDHTDQVGAR